MSNAKLHAWATAAVAALLVLCIRRVASDLEADAGALLACAERLRRWAR